MTPAREIWGWLSPSDRRDAVLAGGILAGIGAWSSAPGLLPLALLGALALAISRIDSRHALIPDLLTLVLALAGFAHGLGSGAAAGPALLAAAVTFALLEAFRRLAGRAMGRPALGGGDVKLIAAAALWLPPEQMPTYILAAALSGLAEAALTSRRRLAFGRHLAPWLCLLVLVGPGLRL